MSPIEKKFINGSHLKILAVIVMLIDHIGYHILDFIEDAHQVWFTCAGLEFSPYFISRFLGRSAFPIFSFLLVEGFIHTHNRLKYGRNLLLFAFISELPWNLINSNQLLFERQNVFFTLFLGFLSLSVLKRFRTSVKKLLVSLLLIFTAAYFLRADYGYFGVAFIIAIYVFRSNQMLMTIIGTCLLPQKWIGGLAFIPIAFYNGERGCIQGPLAKYAFYAFYPIHLLVLYFVKLGMFGT